MYTGGWGIVIAWRRHRLTAAVGLPKYGYGPVPLLGPVHFMGAGNGPHVDSLQTQMALRRIGFLPLRRTQVTRVSVFNSPLLLGFDHFERVLDRVSKNQAEGYPPYNIEQTSEIGLRITLAVAGFAETDLSVAVEDNQLVIRGKRQNDDCERIYLHRGIASRQFQRAFVLAEGIEISGASLENGLLHVDLERPIPETKVRHIPIDAKGETVKGAPSRAIDVSALARDDENS